MLESQANAARSTRLRSRVTNGSKLVAGLDGRSAEARRYRDLVMSYSDDLGGADSITEAQRTLIGQAATLQIQSERVQAAVLKGEQVNVEQLTRLANSSTRILTRLGLKRERRDATPDLADYLAAHHAEASPE
jgi:hypothetical protein